MSVKKILFIHPALVTGGAETVLLNYLRMMSQCENYETHVLFLEQKQTNYDALIPNNIKIHFALNHIESEFFIYSHLNKYNSETGKYFSSWYNEITNQYVRQILKIINAENYDVIINFHSNISKFEIFLERYNIHPNIKLINWVHGSGYFNLWKEVPSAYQVSLNKYHKIITICDDMKLTCQQVLQTLEVNKPQIERIYNPLNLDDISTRANKNNDDPLLKEKFIVQVARLEEHSKNHLGMIEIFAQLKAKGIKEKLYIIGDGPSRQQLQDKINDLGLEKECLLLGNRNNPYPYMKAAKLFIHTSRSEGLPTVLIESMACGTPVVAFNCPTGPREILADGKYGGLISLNNNDLFVETVYELLTDENKRQAYIEKLPEAVERFSSEKIGQELETLLNNLTTIQ